MVKMLVNKSKEVFLSSFVNREKKNDEFGIDGMFLNNLLLVLVGILFLFLAFKFTGFDIRFYIILRYFELILFFYSSNMYFNLLSRESIIKISIVFYLPDLLFIFFLFIFGSNLGLVKLGSFYLLRGIFGYLILSYFNRRSTLP
jgi:hypothetical protein